MYLCKIFFACLTIILMLSACGAEPRPFRALSPEDKFANPLLDQRDGVGINIHVTDSTPYKGAELVELALLKSLELENIPATSGGALGNGHQLMGRIYIENNETVFSWSLFNQYGQGLGEGSINIADNQLDSDFAKYVADNTADEISIILKPENMHALAVVNRNTNVAVIEVTGAPGDGNIVLPKAMRLMLQQANIPTTTDPALAILHVSGRAKLIQEANGDEKMRIVWSFKRPNGEELGTITQENAITPGSLNQKWGDSAYDVALAMVGTVASALEVAQNKRH